MGIIECRSVAFYREYDVKWLCWSELCGYIMNYIIIVAGILESGISKPKVNIELWMCFV